MKTVAIVQARTSSTRLPGKVLQPLCGMPMIAFMLARVSRAERVDELIVATSEDPADDPLADCVRSLGFNCHRGSLDDVLARFHGAAAAAEADIVVRLTGDCPLMDADLVDQVVGALVAAKADYAANISPPSFPDGLDAEAFTFAALERTHRHATLKSEREHVTPYMRDPKNGFRSAGLQGISDMSHLRWTVDYPDDLEFVASLLQEAGITEPGCGDRFDFYRALERRPALMSINQHTRNEGYAKSLAEDRTLAP